MTILQTTQSYASALDLKYDEAKQRYIGEFVSRGGAYQIEGVNRADVEYEMDRLLQEEYHAMVRDVAYKQSFAHGVGDAAGGGLGLGLGMGAAMGGGGGGRGHGGGNGGYGRGHSNNKRPDIISGQKVFVINADEQGRPLKGERSAVGKVFSWVDLVTGGLSLLSGNWLEVGITAMTMAFEDWFSGTESLWDKKPQKVLYAVMFGGILITAKSRSELRKKLQRQKNHRIQRILMHVRKKGFVDGDPEDEARGSKGEKKSADRLKAKKKKAQILKPKKWEKRVSPQGQETGWRGKSMDMRDRMKGKKERSKALWAHKLG